MGLKALFNKESRRERAVQKACLKAVNTKIKPEDRRPALDTLLEDGSEEAITALLGRFNFNYDTNMVSDEEEKNVVYQGLLTLGPAILPALRRHLAEAPTLSWGLRLLGEVCDHETTWEVLSEALQRFEPGYDRDPSRKIQLLTFLGDFQDERVPEQLLPYLEDHDETVRFSTVEALLRHRAEIAREPLLKLLISDDEESLRLKNRVAEGFVEIGWTVKGYRGSVESALAEDFIVDGKGHIKKRPRK